MGFWFYDNSHRMTLVWFFLMVFSLISALIFETRNKLTHDKDIDFSIFLYFIPFFVTVVLFLFFFSRANKKWWEDSSNYLIVIDLAIKFYDRLEKNGTLSGHISSKIFDLIKKVEDKKDSKELTAWMVNYRTYEKHQKSLEEKRKQLEDLQNLPVEISEMEKISKTLWDGLMW